MKIYIAGGTQLPAMAEPAKQELKEQQSTGPTYEVLHPDLGWLPCYLQKTPGQPLIIQLKGNLSQEVFQTFRSSSVKLRDDEGVSQINDFVLYTENRQFCLFSVCYRQGLKRATDIADLEEEGHTLPETNVLPKTPAKALTTPTPTVYEVRHPNKGWVKVRYLLSPDGRKACLVLRQQMDFGTEFSYFCGAEIQIKANGVLQPQLEGQVILVNTDLEKCIWSNFDVSWNCIADDFLNK